LAVNHGAGHSTYPSGLAIAVRLRAESDRMVCTGAVVETDGQELTATMFHSLRLGELTRAAARFRLGTYAEPIDRARRARRPGPRQWTDDHLALVAEEYRHELQAGSRSPVTTLARRLRRHRSTIHRMLTEARRRGLDEGQEEEQ
jgi:hypothetical protein